MIDSSAYNPVEPVPEKKSMIIWRRKQKRPDPLALAAEYERDFHEIREGGKSPLKNYVVANLKMLFYGPQSK